MHFLELLGNANPKLPLFVQRLRNLNICRVLIIYFVNVYPPKCNDNKFFEILFYCITCFETVNNVIGGHLNLFLDIDRDKNGRQTKTYVNSQICVKKYLEDLDLCDVCRDKNPTLLEYTWQRHKPAFVQYRLDYFLISQRLVNCTMECSLRLSFISDHSIVKLKLKMQMLQKGVVSGHWTCEIKTTLIE